MAMVTPSDQSPASLTSQSFFEHRTRVLATPRPCFLRPGRTSWTAALAFALLGACTSTSSDATSTGNGTTGGETTGSETTSGGTTGGGSSTSQGTETTSTSTTGDAASDSGPIGGPSTCQNHHYLLCEGFEDTPVGDAPPSGWTQHGNASVADDAAARGAHSMKIAAAANGERRFYYSMASQFGAAHWGRIFYKVQTPVPDPFVHSTIVALFGTGPTMGPAEYRVVDTVKNANSPYHQFLYNVQPSGAEFGTGSAYVYKFDGNWHCAEWHIDGTNQGYDFYYDGQHLGTIAIANGAGNYQGSDIPSSFDELRVGWNNYQAADPGFVAWIDEIAIDSARIGCND
jgi:hypothetical protein